MRKCEVMIETHESVFSNNQPNKQTKLATPREGKPIQKASVQNESKPKYGMISM